MTQQQENYLISQMHINAKSIEIMDKNKNNYNKPDSFFNLYFINAKIHFQKLEKLKVKKFNNNKKLKKLYQIHKYFQKLQAKKCLYIIGAQK